MLPLSLSFQACYLRYLFGANLALSMHSLSGEWMANMLNLG